MNCIKHLNPEWMVSTIGDCYDWLQARRHGIQMKESAFSDKVTLINIDIISNKSYSNQKWNFHLNNNHY